MMTEKNKINRYFKTLFYILAAFIIVGYIYGQKYYPSEREPMASKDELTYKEPVYWERQDGSKEKIELPGEFDVNKGETMVVTTTLPADFKENSIAIRGSLQDVKIYIDGDLRTKYDTKESRPFGSNSASRYVFCDTSHEDAGKELRIELVSNSSMYSGVVNEIYCGDRIDIWGYIFGIYGRESVIALFILFAGILTIIFSIALSIIYKFRINLEYLGWCMVIGAVWLLGESKLRQLVTSNASIVGYLCFIMVMICPLPFLFYVDGVQKGRYRKLYYVLEGLATLNLTVSTILQFAEIADYIDTLFVTHIIFVVTSVAVFLTFLIDFYKKRIKEYSVIVIGMLAGMAGALGESISVYFVVSISGIFLGAGLLVLLSVAVLSTIKDIRDTENRRNREQIENKRKQTEAMSLQMIQTLSTTLEAKDEYTKGHSERVAFYAGCVAEELGWSKDEVENLKNAARLHDVGKIGVPDTILNKPTKLLDEEYEIIKKHTTIGAEILKNITLIDHAEDVARYHHERFDGKGYPEGLSGSSIPVQARIVAVADSYDAMNSKRIYRNPLSEEVIREELVKNEGKQFDPKISRVFIKLLDEGRLVIDEEAENMTKGEKSLEFEENGASEAGMFISSVVDTMKSQQETENMDFLTGLPMRNLGEKQIAQKMHNNSGCLVFIDMDNLKKINDIFGHRAGDKALKLLGKTIVGCKGDKVACRLGGDEFLLFLSDVTRAEAEAVVGDIFDTFITAKGEDVEIRDASLSGGLCMTVKGDSFAECYSKADKALYYIKQNGKNSYSFYHRIEKKEGGVNSGKDLEQVAKALKKSGNYVGALDLDNREFSKAFEYMANLGERYNHSCHLVMITLDFVSGNTMYMEKIEKSLECMEISIRSNIRNVDVCTRYSSMQYLLILMEAGEDNINTVIDRIFGQYYKMYSDNDFIPRYEYMLI